MNFAEVKKLMEIFNASAHITKLSLRQENFELKLDKSFAPPSIIEAPLVQKAPPMSHIPESPNATQIEPSPTTSSTSSGGDFITSPMVGTFYHRPSPDAAPYVKVGDVIKKGQTIGIIEAMKIMNEIEAEFDCKILSIETGDGQPVEYGSNLICVEKV